MYIIPGITTDANQTITVITPTGSPLFLNIYYVPQQFGWFVTNFSYLGFNLKGFRIVVNPNILYQFKNVLQLGFGCIGTADRDPTLQTDFVAGGFQMFLLDAGEVEQFTEFLQNGGQ